MLCSYFTLSILWTVLHISTVQTDYPFRNISLPWSQRVNDLVSRLSLTEITVQLARGGAGSVGGPAPPIKRLGIGPYSWNTECLRGDVMAGTATAFPQALGLAATFSPSLVYRVAEATGVEVRAKYNNYVKHGQYGDHKGISCFSPVINIMRDPRWGRNQETYGEDPVLTGVLASNFVKGLQGNHSLYVRASAGCKHFDAYGGPEDIPVSRFTFNAQVSERDLRTTFLPAFKSCVDAGTYSFMCSFNKVNGIPACAHKRLLSDILRDEWNFTGYVVSDGGAVEDIITQHKYFNNSVDTAAACMNAGCNLELSSNQADPVFFSAVEAVLQGKLNASVIIERVKPLFNTRMRLGEFDPPQMNPYTKLNLSVIQSDNHRNLSLEAAMKSFVLLKNVNNFLPLAKTKYGTIAIVGPMANNPIEMFGDYGAPINPIYTTTPLMGLKPIATQTNYAAGCIDNKCSAYFPQEIEEAVKNTELVVVCLGTGQELEQEGHDRDSLSLSGYQLQLLQDAVIYANGTPVILLLFNAGPLNITWAAYNPGVTAILELFFPAQEAGEAIRRVLLNDGPGAVPAGRLPCTWPKYDYQLPLMTNYSMQGRTYRYFNGEVLWPFGFGLSYTNFFYTALTYKKQVKAGEDGEGYFTLNNIGYLDADEVIQVYISWDHPSVPLPKLQLVDFNRVTIPAKKHCSYNFTIPAKSMAVWVNNKGWIIEPGTLTFYIGGQQPKVKPSVGSNVLSAKIMILDRKYLGKY